MTLEKAAPPGYEVQDSADGSCFMVKQQPADTLSLRVEVISNGSSLRLRATFIARAW
jgi:hypothetical protein